jgi:chitin disaccharide deacetylase
VTERSSQLLGYPPEARVLIINADDFGMCPSINSAVVQSIENGIASSCSVMPPCPGARQALQLLQERRHIPFGIHLTLVCDFSAYRWKPLAPSEKVSSLLDGSGHLFTPSTKTQLLLRPARLQEIELELRMQIEAVLATGLIPTHLDWHALADGGRHDIFDLGLALAEEYQLAARVWLDRGRRVAGTRSLPVVDHDFLDSFLSTSMGRRTATFSCCAICHLGLVSGRCTRARMTRRLARSTTDGRCVAPILSS